MEEKNKTQKKSTHELENFHKPRIVSLSQRNKISTVSAATSQRQEYLIRTACGGFDAGLDATNDVRGFEFGVSSLFLNLIEKWW